jgi:hypothetical protein
MKRGEIGAEEKREEFDEQNKNLNIRLFGETDGETRADSLLLSSRIDWSAKLTFIDTYDSHPVGPGIKKNDIVFIAGVSWKF